MNRLTKTKIIATLGPKTSSKESIETLIISGVNVFRLNFSHGSIEDKKALIDIINKAEKKLCANVSILADLQGPKIRTGITLNNEEIYLKEGTKIFLTSKECISNNDIIYVSYKRLVDDIKKGNRILINDGLISLRAVKVDYSESLIECIVENSGFYSSKKGVNFPDSDLKVLALTEKDKLDLQFILKETIDYVALSFVRTAEDIKALSSLIPKENKLRIIAKIEKPEAVKNIDEIISISDGIMVARGDLGVETSLEKVPLIQKSLIKKAQTKAKTVIVATQMLESMIHSSIPTRAETTDIANAIIDGADALMLSGETAVGAYPYDSVKMMSKIICETEKSDLCPKSIVRLDVESHSISQAICDAAAYASYELGNCPIIVFTLSGQTAWYLSNTRAQGSIFAFSPSLKIVSQLALAWNTRAFAVNNYNDMLSLVKSAESFLLSNNYVKNDEDVIIISGLFSIPGATNNLSIKKIGMY